MAITTTTSQTSLRSSFVRMDAEFFRPEHVAAYKNLDEIKGRYLLGQLCKKVTQGSNPSFSKSGLPCVNGKNIYFGTMQEGEPNYVSEQEFGRLSNYRLHQNDIVITLKHATKIGRAWIVENDNPPMIFSRNVGLIRLAKDSSVKPAVLLMYLWTKSGQLCLDRCATGGTSGQITLPISELKRIPVPPFPESFQIEIDDVFQRSKQAAIASEESYYNAQHLLESELGLDKLKFKKPVGYTARFSDLEQSRRSDSEFFNPELRYFWQNLSTMFELTAISKFAAVLKFSNPTYGIDGIPIVTQKHLRTISPEGYGDELRTTDLWQRINPSAILQNNDLLFYSVGAYLGKTNVWLNSDAAVPASFITLLRCHNESDAGFLHMLLNSRYGILQSKCFQSGTSQQYIYPKDIRKFLIPVIDDRLKTKLNQLVVRSFEKGLEAKSLLAQAKTRVEQLIEEAAKR